MGDRGRWVRIAWRCRRVCGAQGRDRCPIAQKVLTCHTSTPLCGGPLALHHPCSRLACVLQGLSLPVAEAYPALKRAESQIR